MSDILVREVKAPLEEALRALRALDELLESLDQGTVLVIEVLQRQVNPVCGVKPSGGYCGVLATGLPTIGGITMSTKDIIEWLGNILTVLKDLDDDHPFPETPVHRPHRSPA